MVIDFSNFTANDYAAWWGAVIATLALVWNIVIAVRSGARVRVGVNSDVQIIPKQPISGDKTYISVKAVNHGTSPTTITHFCGYYTDSLWTKVRGKKHKFIITTHGGLGQTVPHVLTPGEEWSSLADQESVFLKAVLVFAPADEPKLWPSLHPRPASVFPLPPPASPMQRPGPAFSPFAI